MPPEDGGGAVLEGEFGGRETGPARDLGDVSEADGAATRAVAQDDPAETVDGLDLACDFDHQRIAAGEASGLDLGVGAADRGGIFWQEICAAMQGLGHPLIQGYLTGVGGSDVIPKTVHEVADDLAERTEAGEPVWKGL